MRVLDLFAGLCGWSEAFAERGHDVRSLDFDERFDVTYHADVMTFSADDLDDWRPDIVLASPPCEGFSVMNIGRNWGRATDAIIPGQWHEPKSETARIGLMLVQRTRQLIDELQPRYFVIENPRAKLRKLPVMSDVERRAVWYCHYGETTAKPTDLFGVFPEAFVAERECHNQHVRHASDCCCRDHASAPRGSTTEGSIQGVKGKDSDAVRAKVPHALSLAMCIAAETSLANDIAVMRQPELWEA